MPPTPPVEASVGATAEASVGATVEAAVETAAGTAAEAAVVGIAPSFPAIPEPSPPLGIKPRGIAVGLVNCKP